MAGAGFKDFAVGEVLTATDVDTYLMQQSVMRFADSAARGSALGTAVLAEGMVSYLDDENEQFFYDGTSWLPVRKIVEVKYAAKTVEQTLSLAAAAVADVTSLTFSHALSDSSNLMILFAAIQGSTSTTNRTGNFYIDASGTPILVGAASGSRQQAMFGFTQTNGDSWHSASGFGVYAPGSTASVTYKVVAQNQSSDARTIYVNRTANNTDSDVGVVGYSSLIGIEVRP